MDVILNELNIFGPQLTSKQREYCLNELGKNILQSDTKNYSNYFSSKPIPGSVVEDIAEVDAEIALIEKKIKDILVSNKETVLEEILKNNSTSRFNSIRKELQQLRELNDVSKSSQTTTMESTTESNKKDNFHDFIDSHESRETKSENDDEFQTALQRLRNRTYLNNNYDKTGTNSTNLPLLLENLDNITDLMELPFLARTCIKTGHYQEAIMVFTHSKSLQAKFPGSTIIDDICDKVSNEISTTMLTGLVKLLATNVTANSLKKILKYLSAIPPFDSKDNSSSLLQVFLSMRFLFIQREIASYAIEKGNTNDSVLEMMIKRKIEVLREYTFTSINLFEAMFPISKEPLSIPNTINMNIMAKNGQPVVEKVDKEVATSQEETQDNDTIQEKETSGEVQEKETDEKAQETDLEVQEKQSASQAKTTTQTENNLQKAESLLETAETNPLMLEFVNQCITYLLKELVEASPNTTLSDSVCLQLIYCSFRLRDLNINYHHLLLHKAKEANLFTEHQIVSAINRRSELSSRYT